MKSLPLLFLCGLMVVSASPASAESALEASLTLSDPSPQAQDVVYSWDVGVNSPVTANSLEVSVPAGTGGQPRPYLVDGLPSGDIEFDGRTIVFHFGGTTFSAGHRIIFAVSGLSNAGDSGEFISSTTLGDHTTQTPAVILDGRGVTRAMVFVTSEAAQLSRQDPSPTGNSTPVLMANEQEPVYAGQARAVGGVPMPGWFPLLLLASLLLVVRKRISCIV